MLDAGRGISASWPLTDVRGRSTLVLFV